MDRGTENSDENSDKTVLDTTAMLMIIYYFKNDTNDTFLIIIIIMLISIPMIELMAKINATTMFT